MLENIRDVAVMIKKKRNIKIKSSKKPLTIVYNQWQLHYTKTGNGQRVKGWIEIMASSDFFKRKRFGNFLPLAE